MTLVFQGDKGDKGERGYTTTLKGDQFPTGIIEGPPGPPGPPGNESCPRYLHPPMFRSSTRVEHA